uniref:probable WRKY transcription factor 14 n=1 Tax=Erigeron canadensis TaxID=72917 RepID=UPI001CB9196B|nr:probable WRKY transcription factor 14 [Erigeron canadensis]
MENNNFHGDLADIFRPGSVNSSIDPGGVSVDHWQYFDHDNQEITHPHQKSNLYDDDDDDHEGFGQPCFTSLLSDPLIAPHQGTSSSSTPPPCFFGTTTASNDLVADEQQPSSTTTRIPSLRFDDHHQHRHQKTTVNVNHNNQNIFSKMLQISPNATKSSTNNNEMNMIITSSTTSNSSSSTTSATKRGLMEASTTLQISSQRNPGIKRRKSQAKKVVCIPAPAPANSRPTGEVVPSDLWAWRKYGQKPIKGSPYPRGYYRCSSSKGCSARKQVERSRTDPNMLVITYTSEHNHPWPTQRNALAGSTRTPQPPKTTTTNTTTTEQPQQKEEIMATTTVEDEIRNGSSVVLQVVKDELQVFEGAFPQGYRPELPAGGGGGGGGGGDDFFSGLGEIDVDPISLLLNQGFLGGGDDEEAQNFNKDLDPFG